jgi:hypothetical protein
MKQTAVEFLQEALSIHFTHEQEMQFIGLFNQVLEMEKEQIMDAYEIGFADAWDDVRYDDSPTYAGAEQYYNEIYKSKL